MYSKCWIKGRWIVRSKKCKCIFLSCRCKTSVSWKLSDFSEVLWCVLKLCLRADCKTSVHFRTYTTVTSIYTQDLLGAVYDTITVSMIVAIETASSVRLWFILRSNFFNLPVVEVNLLLLCLYFYLSKSKSIRKKCTSVKV